MRQRARGGPDGALHLSDGAAPEGAADPGISRAAPADRNTGGSSRHDDGSFRLLRFDRFQNGAGRHHAALDVAPQLHEQLPGHRHDAHPTHPRAALAVALVESAIQRAVRLEAERRLDHRRPAGEEMPNPFDHEVEWARQALTAGSPATEPITAETTGTISRSSASTADQTLPSGR